MTNFNKIPMTVQGEQKLKKELQQLIQEERPQISSAIGEAREHGDLKENAEYHAAKEKQGMIEARIAFIQGQLKNAQVIDIQKVADNDHVVFGATVSLINLEDEKKLRFQIVGEEEADIKQEKLSITAPIARACIGKQIGDTLEVSTPNGLVEYELENIEYIV